MKLPYTYIDEFVTNFYKDIGVLSPEDISIEKIADMTGIQVEFLPLPHFLAEVDGDPVIIIDSRSDEFEQKSAFLHELCHCVRHKGNQLKMNSMFCALQEQDAELFMLYALMPSHMLYLVNFYDRCPVTHVSEIFNVPIDVAFKRIEKIKQTYMVYA